MPTMTSYPNGMTLGSAGHNGSPEKRGQVKGWSAGAVRRHTRFLYSIEASELDGIGLAITLTLRDTPASAVEFHRLRRAWLMRVERLGAVRSHWVIEWQRRGAPHMHTAVYFPEDSAMPAARGVAPLGADAGAAARTEAARRLASLCIAAWIAVAGDYGTAYQSQYWDDIDGPVGWLKYLSKHAGRGVKHYQRAGHPEGWETSGRLWGHVGEWPTVDAVQADLSMKAYHRLRRLVRAWAVAGARADYAAQLAHPVRDAAEQAQRLRAGRSRIKWTRGMLACSDRRLAPVRGVSQWIPEAVMVELLMMVEAEGIGVVGR